MKPNHLFRQGIIILILLVSIFSCNYRNNPSAGTTANPAYIQLPEYVVTPDGMAIAPDGDLLVSCPNYGDQTKSACIVKINKNYEVALFYTFPPLSSTDFVCPMGIEVALNGDIFICDNQAWSGKAEGQFKGRILKLKVKDNKVDTLIEVATGLEHPNGLKIKGNSIFVTQSLLTKIKDKSGLLTSAVYRFNINDENIQVTNTLADSNLLVKFLTNNTYCQYGLDGLVFDSKGNLLVGNFGDGTLHKIILDNNNKPVSVELFAKTDFDYSLNPQQADFLAKATKCKMRTTDGICIDSLDNVYVADFSNNAIAKVSPTGVISVVRQDPDNNGTDGKLNQPGEPIVWNNRLMVTNFDIVTGPDKVNTKHDSIATLTIINLIQ